MSLVRNAELAAAMAEYGLTRSGLADLVNATTELRTGRPGEASERWVYYLLAGKILWPRPPQRDALEEILGVSALDLGFRPPTTGSRQGEGRLRMLRTPRGGAGVDRRHFLITAGTSALAINLPDLSDRARLGMSDVERLREPLNVLAGLDDRHGGRDLAPAAAAVVSRIETALERCPMSERVQRSLYALAGEYLASAGWYAIDAHDITAASRYLDHALRVASIGRDAMLQAQIWNAMAWRADQAGNHAEVVAIAQTALTSAASRRNPKIAALWHGWVAQGHAWRGHRSLAKRSLGRAHDSLTRTGDTTPTPPWLAFLDHAEIDSQACYSYLLLGDYSSAGTSAYLALRATPPSFTRNAASRTLMLASAYLGQRDVEAAASAAHTALDLAGDLRSGRLQRNYQALHDRFAPWKNDLPAAATWMHRYREQRWVS